jgi:hypothetical protein
MDDPNQQALDEAAGVYDRIEQEYLDALAAGADEQRLLDLAARAVDAAKAWEIADYAAPPEPGFENYYSVPEVMWNLWVDIAAAYEKRAE